MEDFDLVGKNNGGKATAIEKALRILMLFSPDNRDFTTTEVSEMVGYHKATVSKEYFKHCDITNSSGKTRMTKRLAWGHRY